MCDCELNPDKIKTMEGAKLSRRLAVCNVLLGILYICVGISYFFLSTFSFVISNVVIAIFLVIFGVILISYHVHLTMVEDWMYNNFGFMYDWRGRAAYLLFNGFMCISLGTFGIVVGIITLLILLFNVYCLRINNDLRQLVKREDLDFKQKHASSPVVGNDKSQPNPGNHDVASSEVWEEVVDPESGKKYYYNPSTGETSWTLPNH